MSGSRHRDLQGEVRALADLVAGLILRLIRAEERITTREEDLVVVVPREDAVQRFGPILGDPLQGLGRR